jgi:hypothetical protein
MALFILKREEKVMRGFVLDYKRDEQSMPLENSVYARVLWIASLFGFLIAFIAFLLYLTGIVEPRIPLARVPELWSLSSREALRLSGIPGGWGWLHLVDRSDMLCYAALAVTASGTIVALISVFIVYLSRRNFLYALIVLLELIVLCLAASGFIPDI